MLRACLHSLKQQRRVEIVVVDNASSDSSVAIVQEEFPDVILDKQAHNLGFAKALNKAASLASGDIFLLLNPDTELPVGGVRSMSDAFAEQPQASVMGFRQVDRHSSSP